MNIFLQSVDFQIELIKLLTILKKNVFVGK